MALIAFETYYDPVLANIALSKLKANDIPCFLTNEHTTQMLWHMSMAMGGIKLMLNPSDRSSAQEILEYEPNILDRAIEPDINTEYICPACKSEK